ncbi:DMT family transporter [Parasulfuritortus cantonensis]|uniref:DMT family transporter n=2 Tax=Parasulfuritortus cantonensis TaxID=2528202 RepID=A0A4R1BE05_9PROT|nr:DMT family transporter [Parasulfuritortus cantonensis]
MLAAGASFALMSVFVKLAAGQFSSHELVFWRSLLGLAFIYVFLRLPVAGRAEGGLASAHLAMHLRRGVVGFVALATFFYAITRLPMSVAITLNYTSPLFLALVMPWWLGERPRPLQYLAVALGFLGVALLLRPWQGAGDLKAGLAGLFSGFMAALAYVHVRQLGKLGEPEWRTVFWFAAVSSLGAGLFAGLSGWHAPSLANAWLLAAMGLFATFGQLAMTRAYRRGDTVVVASLAYSTVVFGSLLDGLIWNEDLPFIAWLGIALTVAAGVWAVVLNKKEPT